MSEEEVKAMKEYSKAAKTIYSTIRKLGELLQKYKNSSVFDAFSELIYSLYGVTLLHSADPKDDPLFETLFTEKRENVSKYKELWPYYAYYSFIYKRTETVSETREVKRVLQRKKTTKKERAKQMAKKKKLDRQRSRGYQNSYSYVKSRRRNPKKIYYQSKKLSKFYMRPLLSHALKYEHFSVLNLMMEKVPALQPAILYRLTLKCLASHKNEEAVYKLWEAYLSTINAYIADSKVKFCLSVLYELNKVNKVNANSAMSLYREELYTSDIQNHIMYALLDEEYGYILNCLCRLKDERVKSLVSKYELSLNWMSVEEYFPLMHKNYVTDSEKVLRPALQRTLQVWIKHRYYFNQSNSLIHLGDAGSLKSYNFIVTCPLIEMGNINLADIERQIASVKPKHRK
jgi:hypothetical protein